MTAIESLKIARDHKISPSGLAVLLVAMDDSPVRATDIAERTGCSKANVTGRLDHLERDGWIQRAPNRADRRSLWITPTQRAFDIFTPCLVP